MTVDGKTGAHCYSGYSASRYPAGQSPHGRGGGEMVSAIRQNGGPVSIKLNRSGNNSATLGSFSVAIDVVSAVPLRQYDSYFNASPERRIGHELGHAVFGTDDAGPRKMKNVLENEEPIAMALCDPNTRTDY